LYYSQSIFEYQRLLERNYLLDSSYTGVSAPYRSIAINSMVRKPSALFHLI